MSVLRVKVTDKMNEVSNGKKPFRMEIGLMNKFIGLIFKKSVQVNKKSLNNAYRLFNMVDETIYDNSPKLKARLQFIKRGLEARVKQGFEDKDIIINYCKPDIEDANVNEIIDNLDIYGKLNYEEIRHLNKSVEDRLTYVHVLDFRGEIYRAVEDLDSGNFDTYKDMNGRMLEVARNLITSARAAEIVETENTWSLEDGEFEERTEEIVKELKDPSRIIKTGIRALNEILGLGFHGKRLYTFFGLPKQIGQVKPL